MTSKRAQGRAVAWHAISSLEARSAALCLDGAVNPVLGCVPAQRARSACDCDWNWLQRGEPRLALSVAEVSAQGLALIRNGSDMCVYADRAAWLIEVFHEGTVSGFGKGGARKASTSSRQVARRDANLISQELRSKRVEPQVRAT